MRKPPSFWAEGKNSIVNFFKGSREVFICGGERLHSRFHMAEFDQGRGITKMKAAAAEKKICSLFRTRAVVEARTGEKEINRSSS